MATSKTCGRPCKRDPGLALSKALLMSSTWYIPVHTKYIAVCTSTYYYVFLQLPYHTYQYDMVCTCMYWYVPVHTSTYWYIPAFTLISNSPTPSFPVTRYIKYITVHGSTRKYPKVLYTWIMTVQQGR